MVFVPEALSEAEGSGLNPIPWSKQLPTMVDSVSHGDDSHGVNKRGFKAFLVDNRGGRAELNAEGVVREAIPSAPSRSRLTLADPTEECGGTAGQATQGVGPLQWVGLYPLVTHPVGGEILSFRGGVGW